MTSGHSNQATNGDGQSLVFSYLVHRETIGLLGMALPFALYFGASWFFDSALQDSLSAYYHTGMRDVFVGILFAIGFFLLSYHGYDACDRWLGNLACLFAVGVALFPTAPADPTPREQSIGVVHHISALMFFVALIVFAFHLFSKTHEGQKPKGRKLWRNRVYKACGTVMVLCIVGIGVYRLVLPEGTGRARRAAHPGAFGLRLEWAASRLPALHASPEHDR